MPADLPSKDHSLLLQWPFVFCISSLSWLVEFAQVIFSAAAAAAAAAADEKVFVHSGLSLSHTQHLPYVLLCRC